MHHERRAMQFVCDSSLGHSSSDNDSYRHRYDRSAGAQLPVRKSNHRRDQEHPKYDPDSVRCSFCKEYGHSLMNCWTRMRHHWLRMDTHCKKGYHKPHLHDCDDLWRCEWCLMHLRTSYVEEFYPREYDYEREKVRTQKAVNLARYSDSADSSA